MEYDVTPFIYESIKKDFDLKIKNDKQINDVLKGKSNADYDRLYELADRVGTYATASILKHFNDDSLPNDKLYWHIAIGTIKPIMELVNVVINDLYKAMQSKKDAANGINMKVLEVPFDEERIEAIMNKVVALSLEDESNE